jgi:hypothetical protein
VPRFADIGWRSAATGDPSWVVPDEEVHRHFNELQAKMDADRYGRRAYEQMVAYAPEG